MALGDYTARDPTPFFHWAMMGGVTILIALLGWFAAQLVAMRDDIHTLKDQVPLQIQGLDRRVTMNEQQLETLDQAIIHQGEAAR